MNNFPLVFFFIGRMQLLLISLILNEWLLVRSHILWLVWYLFECGIPQVALLHASYGVSVTPLVNAVFNFHLDMKSLWAVCMLGPSDVNRVTVLREEKERQSSEHWNEVLQHSLPIKRDVKNKSNSDSCCIKHSTKIKKEKKGNTQCLNIRHAEVRVLEIDRYCGLWRVLSCLSTDILLGVFDD